MTQMLIGFGIGVLLGILFIAMDIWHFERTGYYIGEKPK